MGCKLTAIGWFFVLVIFFFSSFSQFFFFPFFFFEYVRNNWIQWNNIYATIAPTSIRWKCWKLRPWLRVPFYFYSNACIVHSIHLQDNALFWRMAQVDFHWMGGIRVHVFIWLWCMHWIKFSKMWTLCTVHCSFLIEFFFLFYFHCHSFPISLSLSSLSFLESFSISLFSCTQS